MNTALNTAATRPPPHAAGQADPQKGATEARDVVRKIRIEGDEEAGRALTLRFCDLVQGLASMPAPAPVSYFAPGIDLLHALTTESADFGAASPGTAASTAIAEGILGITDEALDRAEEILIATDEDSGYHNQAGLDPGLSLLLMHLGGLSIRAERSELRDLPAARDQNIGGEFY